MMVITAEAFDPALEEDFIGLFRLSLITEMLVSVIIS
jgi:hypothetical protein